MVAIRNCLYFLVANWPATHPLTLPRTSPVIKRPNRVFDHSHTSSAEATNAWKYTSNFPYAFKVGRLIMNRHTMANKPLKNQSIIKQTVSWPRPIGTMQYTFLLTDPSDRYHSKV
jgi:hypothetical protein